LKLSTNPFCIGLPGWTCTSSIFFCAHPPGGIQKGGSGDPHSLCIDRQRDPATFDGQKDGSGFIRCTWTKPAGSWLQTSTRKRGKKIRSHSSPRANGLESPHIWSGHDLEMEVTSGSFSKCRSPPFSGKPIAVNFQGNLREDQAEALSLTFRHDEGVLCAPTAFGKTVVAAN